MPPSLGARTHYPSSVDLSLFGLGCVPAARGLLDAYVETLRLALSRFDDVSTPRRLTRTMTQDALGLDEHTMKLLSVLIVGRGNVFLSGGNASVEAWDLEIDERIVSYEHITTSGELLATLAEQWLTKPTMSMEPRVSPTASAHLPVAQSSEDQPSNADQRTLANAGSLALGITANGLALALAPLPLALGALGFTFSFVALHRQVMRQSPSRSAIAATIAIGLTVGFMTWLIQGTGPSETESSTSTTARSTTAQLDGVLQRAAKEGRRAVFQASARLHGPGAPVSQVLVLRDKRLKEHPEGDIPTDTRGRFVVPGSDEIRIYDSTDDGYRLAFRFLPQGPGQVRQLPEGDWPGFRFRASPVTDIDGDGRPEIVGTFERVTLASGPMPTPVLISWDDGEQRYRLAPLIQDPPRLSDSTAAQRAQFTGYTRPTILQDRYSNNKVLAYATDHYKIVTDHPDAF